MFKFLDLKYDAFGLDIDDMSVKVVKLKKKGRGFALASFNETRMTADVVKDGEIENEAIMVRAIKSACDTVKGKKLGTRNVVVSLPEQKSFLQVIQMPKMGEEELAVAVPLEAENYIPMPIDDVYLDFHVIPSVKDYLNHVEVLIVATPKKIVDSYISCIKKAGLTPIALEVESRAITMALIKKDANSSLLALIDFGESNVNFIIFSGNSTRFTCSIPISSRSITEAISESLKVNFNEAEKLKLEYGLVGKKSEKSTIHGEKVSSIITKILDDLISQIKKYLNFYRDHSSYEYLLPDGKKENILLCGEGAELKGLPEFVSKKLDIPAELGNPLSNLNLDKDKIIIKKELLSFTTAIGLALRQVDNN
ncbi:MAG: type IV pilus assembly protein PilM [Candidatus Staskawiczbacteria bacterium]|nr:type IV pilus assembly protein PilM [Candidatus Staskawiczbacteria bacterium]